MTPSSYERIRENPKFQALVQRRTRLAAVLSAAILVIYFGFILLVAYAPGFLGTPIGVGVMTIGVPLGLFVIVAAFALTGIYVARANTTFDRMNEEILRELDQ
jgi:uncharacterized membrane protein (DUF485 family)